MSKNQQTNIDISTLPEQEQLIYLFYYFEVSNVFLGLQIGWTNTFQALSKIASLTPEIPFTLSRSTFVRRAREMRVAAAAAKAVGNDPTSSLDDRMKKKADQVKNMGSNPSTIPEAMHVRSVFPFRHWRNEENLPPREVVVTWHRFAVSSLVCKKHIFLEWLDPKHLKVGYVYPLAFRNSCIIQQMLVDNKGRPVMQTEVALMVEGFENHRKMYCNPLTGNLEISWVIEYTQDQDTLEFFRFSEDHPASIYLQSAIVLNEDGEEVPHKELHVVTREKLEPDEFVVHSMNGPKLNACARLGFPSSAPAPPPAPATYNPQPGSFGTTSTAGSFGSASTAPTGNNPYNPYNPGTTSTAPPSNNPYNPGTTSTAPPSNNPYNPYNPGMTSTAPPSNNPYNPQPSSSYNPQPGSFGTTSTAGSFGTTSTAPPSNNPYNPQPGLFGTTSTPAFPGAQPVTGTPFQPLPARNVKISFGSATAVPPAAARVPARAAARSAPVAHVAVPKQAASTNQDAMLGTYLEKMKLEWEEQKKLVEKQIEEERAQARQMLAEERARNEENLQRYRAEVQAAVQERDRARIEEERARSHQILAEERARNEENIQRYRTEVQAAVQQHIQQVESKKQDEIARVEQQKQAEIANKDEALSKYAEHLQQENRQIRENAMEVVNKATAYEQEVRMKKDSGPNKRLRHRADEDHGRNTPIDPDSNPGINITPRTSPVMNMVANQESPTLSDLHSYNDNTMVPMQEVQGEQKKPPAAHAAAPNVPRHGLYEVGKGSKQ